MVDPQTRVKWSTHHLPFCSVVTHLLGIMDPIQLQVTIFMIPNNIHLSVALNSMPDKEWCT